jgi:hypothetical protein
MNKASDDSEVIKGYEAKDSPIILNFASVIKVPANRIPEITKMLNSMSYCRLIYRRFSTKHLIIVESGSEVP